MSLVWMDGFEGYGNGDTNPSVQFARRYAVADTTDFLIVAGRTGGYAVKSVSGSYYFQTPALTTNSTMIVSFGYRTDYAVNSYGICALYDGATQGVTLNLTAAGQPQVVCGSTVLATTSALGIAVGVWCFIELKVVCGPSGSFEPAVLRGATVATPPASIRRPVRTPITIASAYSGGPYANPCTDDFFVFDGAGTVNNNFLGNNKIVAMLPDADGDATNWSLERRERPFCLASTRTHPTTTPRMSRTRPPATRTCGTTRPCRGCAARGDSDFDGGPRDRRGELQSGDGGEVRRRGKRRRRPGRDIHELPDVLPHHGSRSRRKPLDANHPERRTVRRRRRLEVTHEQRPSRQPSDRPRR